MLKLLAFSHLTVLLLHNGKLTEVSELQNPTL